VIAFSQSDKGRDKMITRRVAVIKRLVSEPMCERVDAEGSLLHEEDAENASVDVSSHPITPTDTGNEGGKHETHKDDNLEIVLVLPNNDWVLVKIADIGTANTLRILLHDHPSEVGVEETFADRVRVLVGIGVSVMSSVVSGPPSDGSFNGTPTHSSKKDSQWPCGGI